ncbi:MAG: winged helix-turn-helix transcriptional regulator [Afipia felis]|nr:winged helix-turn-helix transcriptional regulator [Afipia felis]
MSVLQTHALQNPILTCGEFILDRDALRAWRDTHELNLSLRQLRILELFMERPGQTVSRAFIRSTVWGYAATAQGNSVDVEIGQIRKILRSKGGDNAIKTIRGSGFVFQPKEAKRQG